MMMMASSSSSSASGRDGQQATKLTRHNSSFLGAIKNIVTAPFSWFSNVDGGPDVAGSKRRRPESVFLPTAASSVQEMPTDIIIGEQTKNGDEDDLDEAPRRSKRMRLNSPSRAIKATTEFTMRRSSVVPRASSAVLPSSRRASRATLSPARNTQLYPPTIQRTMSIDPPQLGFRRDIPSASFNFGVDVDMVGLDTNDLSMPPSPSRLSPRPSFRMRSSMTPQPTHPILPQRHISEPPPLNSLFSNPVFVHPPLQEKEATPIPTSVPTLGTLVDSARNVRLPVKHQHASLLFHKPDEDETQNDVPAERALQQLDIYKTPLLPSRMRSDADSITASVIPDMFKSRRASRPVLMSDDREKSSAKKKGPIVNETKPYAGQGGMKKLLARAKLEAEKEMKDGGGQNMDNTGAEVSVPPSVPLPPPPPPPPPLVTPDWFNNAVSGTSASSSGSSLRVGRQKTSRHHFQRPLKSRFSAVYEDEGDDAMDDDERAKERRMLEEAATKVPVFEVASEFTFAKDTPAPLPSADDLQKAKEPPINSLPFSLSKPLTPSELPKADSAPKGSQPAPTTSIFGTSKNSSLPLPLTLEKPPSASPAAAPSTNGTAVPNFFATSQVLNGKSKTPPPSVSATSAASGTGSKIAKIPPSTSTSDGKPDAEPNPFLDEKGKEPAKPLPSTFAASGSTSSAFPPIGKPETTAVRSSVLPPSQFTFGKPSEDMGTTISLPATFRSVESKPITAPFSFRRTAEEQKPTPSPFSFDKPMEDKPPSATPAAASNSGTSSLPFAFGKPAAVQEKPSTTGLPFSLITSGEVKEKKAEAASLAPKPLFEPSHTSQSTTTSLFGELPKAATPFTGLPPPQSTPSPLPFTFGHLPGSGSATTLTTDASTETSRLEFSFGSATNAGSDSTTATQPPEAPKPLFGTFSFSQEKKQQEVSPFSFGAAPSTPPAIPGVKPPTPFTFGSLSSSTSAPVAATPPIAFSFSGGGGIRTDVTTKSPFSFGVAPSSAERPVTPPKLHDQEVRMEESPVREMQVNGKALETPPMINAQFPFGGVTSNGVNGSTLFGGASSGSTAASPTSPFTFGASSTTFAAKKPEESKPFGGFGAPPINTSFSFGKDDSRPTSAFTFGQTPTSTTNLTPAFAFGAPTNANSNPFAAATGSAPGSPSTFTQPVPFAFGAPGGATGSFAFGSQPSSPASGGNVTLPQSTISTTTTFGSGAGFGQTPSPASPFSAPLPLAQSTSSGGTLFTIGAPPAPPVGQRQIKKLPRRGNVKR